LVVVRPTALTSGMYPVIGPFRFAEIKKARAGFPVAPVCFFFYFQTTKSEGVNPPNFEVYISILIRSLRENGRSRGLDKVFPESGKSGINTGG